jgi:hypothetical protein
MNELMKRFVEETGFNDDNPDGESFADVYTWIYKYDYGEWLEDKCKSLEKQLQKAKDMLTDSQLARL